MRPGSTPHDPSGYPESYRDFAYENEDALCCGLYVFPVVLSLAGELGPATRVLDVGCGNGALAGLLLDRGCQVVGIDLSEQGVDIARRRYPGGRFEVLPADARLLERLREPPFDVVVSTEVVEHVYAPDDLLEGCWHALRPGARIVVSTPYHGYLKNVLLAATDRFDEHFQTRIRGGHIKFWSRRTLVAALRDTGFVNCEFKGAGRFPFLWKSMVIAAERPR